MDRLAIALVVLAWYPLSAVAVYWMVRISWLPQWKAILLAATFPLWLPLAGLLNVAVGAKGWGEPR